MTFSFSVAEPTRRESGSLLLFFVLAYALMWLCFFAVVRARLPQSNPLAYAALLLGTFAPSLAAILITALSTGKDGLRELLRPVLRWEVAGKYYVFALTYIVAIKICAALMYRFSTGSWPRFGNFPLYVIPFAIAFSAPFQFGEEVGWRGFALPRMAERWGLPLGSLILGVIWGVWHLPQFFVRGADTYGQSFWFFVAEVSAMSTAFAWLWMRTSGSLLLTMFLHSAINNSKDIVPSVLPAPGNPFVFRASPTGWLTLILLWCCAGFFLLDMSRRQKERMKKPGPSRQRSENCKLLNSGRFVREKAGKT
jgi:membrane protease YdiL (CAAX protease family)